MVVGKCRIGVLGASSLVGRCLQPLLTDAGCQVTAFSRQTQRPACERMEWRQLAVATVFCLPCGEKPIQQWICVAPIWVLPQHFAMLEAYGVKRLVALSSTSCFTKDDSSNPEEQAIARRLMEAEKRLQAWAVAQGVEWIILRPTLIYGFGQDKNIAEIARFVRRVGFFPLFGRAQGLRQPIHAQDVAIACVAALDSPVAVNHAYNISGGETLPYREMVARIFAAMRRPLRLLSVSLSVFRVAVALLRLLPRYRQWSPAMAERMNSDLVFDHAEATRDFGFKPRPFVLNAEDIAG
jgi:nucleoside-diphosphate-sugar epimerase